LTRGAGLTLYFTYSSYSSYRYSTFHINESQATEDYDVDKQITDEIIVKGHVHKNADIPKEVIQMASFTLINSVGLTKMWMIWWTSCTD
jgi:hypothetical protein